MAKEAAEGTEVAEVAMAAAEVRLTEADVEVVDMAVEDMVALLLLMEVVVTVDLPLAQGESFPSHPTRYILTVFTDTEAASEVAVGDMHHTRLL